MNDKDLLRSLADAARREDEQFDARWQQFAEGTLSAAEREQLLQSDPDAARRASAFEPLTDDFKARMKTRIAEQRQASVADNTPGKSDSREHRQRVDRRRVFALAASLFVALGAGVFMLQSPSRPDLASFSVTLSGGGDFRSAPQSSQNTPQRRGFAVGDKLQVVLTPPSQIDEPLTSGVFMATNDGYRQLDAPSVQWSTLGAGRFVAYVGRDLHLPAGDVDLLLIVARAQRMPDDAQVTQRAQDGHNDWRAYPLALTIGVD